MKTYRVHINRESHNIEKQIRNIAEKCGGIGTPSLYEGYVTVANKKKAALERLLAADESVVYYEDMSEAKK